MFGGLVDDRPSITPSSGAGQTTGCNLDFRFHNNNNNHTMMIRQCIQPTPSSSFLLSRHYCCLPRALVSLVVPSKKPRDGLATLSSSSSSLTKIHGKESRRCHSLLSSRNATFWIPPQSSLYTLDGQHHCSFSSQSPQKTTSSASTSSSQKDVDDGIVVLYERNIDRLMRPRAITVVSAFVASYWTWYLIDFVPAMTSVGLSTKPLFGAIGLGTGILMLTGSIIYPRMLLHKVEVVKPSSQQRSQQQQQIRLYAHQAFPFPRLSTTPTAVYTVGQLSIDPSAYATKKILVELNGDISRFDGHVMIKIQSPNNNNNNSNNNNRITMSMLMSPSQWLPFYLLEMSSPSEVKSGSTPLLQAILPLDSPKSSFTTQTRNKKSSQKRPPRR